jgi:predicted HAD superfamily Cof-like phosphohydrolase
MEKQLLQVRAFQTAFGAEMPEKPTMLEEKRAKLRQRLLQEEVTELKKAEDMEDVADALGDILYIAFGTIHEYGLADRIIFIFDEIHKANMAKLGEDGKPIYRKDGKVLKPEGWRPPNLKPILSRRYHLFNSDNATFAESLQAINEAENSRWLNTVKSEMMKNLKWYDRILAGISKRLENSVKKRVSVKLDVDEAYRNRATMTMYGKTTELIDY